MSTLPALPSLPPTTPASVYVLLRFSALGDVAMTLPWVYAAAEGSGEEAAFVYVTRPAMAKLFVAPPAHLYPVPLDLNAYGAWYDMVALAWRLHRSYPRAVIVDLHDVLRTKVCRTVLRLLGHKVQVVEKPRAARQRLLALRTEATLPCALYVPPMSTLYRNTLERAGLSLPRQGAVLCPTSAPRCAAIGIAPYAQHRGKVLPAERLRELLRLLSARFSQHDLLLYAAPGREREELATLLQELSLPRLALTTAQGLAAEIAEMATLQCMVSMDSANAHIAAMVGTPVVSLWGATHVGAGFGAYGQSEEDCVGAALSCRPCSVYGQSPCHRGDYACWSLLDLESVVTRVAHYTTTND